MPTTSAEASLREEVQATLLAEHPDCGKVLRDLQTTYHLDATEAGVVLRALVCNLNARLFPPIRKLELILTEGCNLACAYCFEKSMRENRRMPAAVATAAVDFLLDYSGDAPDVAITLFGGEPTLNFAGIVHVTEYARRAAARRGKSVEVGMTSNGVRLTDDMVDYFAAGGIKVLLSIDGLRATHDRYRLDSGGRGSFDRAMAGLKRLKRVQPWIGVKITSGPDTVAALYDDVLGLYDLGVNQFLIGYATGVPWSEDAMRLYAKQSARLYRWYTQEARPDLRISEFDTLDERAGATFFGCQAARDSVAVSVTGEISPCSKMLAINKRDVLARLGDVFTGITHLRTRLRLTRCSELRSACAAAGIADRYQGGCFASNYTDTGDLFHPSLQDHRLTMLQLEALGGLRPIPTTAAPEGRTALVRTTAEA